MHCSSLHAVDCHTSIIYTNPEKEPSTHDWYCIKQQSISYAIQFVLLTTADTVNCNGQIKLMRVQLFIILTEQCLRDMIYHLLTQQHALYQAMIFGHSSQLKKHMRRLQTVKFAQCPIHVSVTLVLRTHKNGRFWQPTSEMVYMQLSSRRWRFNSMHLLLIITDECYSQYIVAQSYGELVM